jgi:uroporphyrinogen III methyltransferase/synthase
LATIAAEVATAGLRPPSLIVVGECVRQREQIAWFEQRPLFGKRIGVTRAEEQAEPQFSRILELGAEPVLMPTLRIEPPESWVPVDDVMRHLGDRNWIVFTSVNGVRSFFGRLWTIGLDVRALGKARLAAIGRSTAEALNEFHIRADIVPSTFRAEDLAEALRPLVANQRVLWVRADRVRDTLRTELASAGARLEELIAYRHHDIESWPDDVVESLTIGNLNWIGVSSPAIARNIVRMLPSAAWPYIGQRIRVASISPVTTATCQEVGLPVSAEAVEHTWDGILSAIIQAEQAVV